MFRKTLLAGSVMAMMQLAGCMVGDPDSTGSNQDSLSFEEFKA